MLGFRSRLDPVDVAVFDSVSRADQSGPGVTSDGLYTWQVGSGVWSVASHLLATSTAASSNPYIFINPGYADVDISLGVSPAGNDAIYFRIVDANNWLRLKLREYTTSSTVTLYCNYTTYENVSGGCCSQGSGCCTATSNCGCNQVITSCCSIGTCTGCSSCTPFGSCTLSCGTQTVNYYNYYLDLEKMVGGSLSQIANISLGQSVNVTQLRAVAVGSEIEVYCTETPGTETLQGTYTDATNSTATKHGIGRGASNSYTGDGSSLSNFRITLGE